MKDFCPRGSLLLAVALLGSPTVSHAKGSSDFHLVETTISDIQAAYRSGTLSPEDLVHMYLERIAEYDQSNLPQPLRPLDGPQPLNSFMHVNERAAADARRLDLDDLDGEDSQNDDGARRPLFGIPVILKDNIATKDMPTTAGSVALGGSRPKKDAFIVRKLRRAGAIILGKGTLTEFANFIALTMPTGFSSQLRFQLFQAPGADLARVGYGFNPYDPRIDPRTTSPVNDGRPVLQTGGSSSGPGIAVAANLATVGVGTETSGSILSPSGQNSLVGIKPTLGLVSRTGIVPITADQDTAGPMARTVTDAAKLLGVLAGFDEKDPATRACLTPGNCFRDYAQFLNKNALRGARIAVPRSPYWVGLTAAQQGLMQDAIALLRAQGATVDLDVELPDQAKLSNFGSCVTVDQVRARRASPPRSSEQCVVTQNCTTVLVFGFKRDLNAYLADEDFGPGVSASNAGIPVRTVHTLEDVIAFNSAHGDVALKYLQEIAEAAQELKTGPGDDLRNYQDDRKKDLELSRTCGLDQIYKNADGTNRYDAVLFPANRGANAPARAGYPSVIVPGGFIPNPATLPPQFGAKPSPFGVTFSGPAFSEPKLIGFAYAFEQATLHREMPASTPPLTSDVVRQ